MSHGFMARTGTSPGVGQMLSYSYTQSSANTLFDTTCPAPDDTPLEKTEVSMLLEVTMTPVSATSLLVIECFPNAMIGANWSARMGIFKDSDTNSLAETAVASNDRACTFVTLKHHVATSGSGSRTYKMGMGNSGGGSYKMNGQETSSYFENLGAAYISVTEIAQ